MASILYNDHLIVSFPVFDEATQRWGVKVQVTLIDKKRTFDTNAGAERYGFEIAKRLIDSLDQHLP
jgi:ssDNA-binding replication factor A large subunit